MKWRGLRKASLNKDVIEVRMGRGIAVLIVCLLACVAGWANVYEAKVSPLMFSTEHFDIIYTDDTASSALRIANRCEADYKMIADSLKTDMKLRMPVVISPASNALNAYYSMMPYPRILLMDTVSNNDELACLDDGLEDVFLHELSHAVSLNLRTPFWQSVSNAIGAWVNPARWFYLNTAFIEGLAVACESLDGSGRLNDPFSMRLLSQGKIEGKDINWLDICGERDIKPSGKLPYFYGGAFSGYLIEKFGMPAYSRFITSCSSMGWSLVPGKFSAAFHSSITDQFSMFLDSIPVPHDVREIGEDLYVSRTLDDLLCANGMLHISDMQKHSWVRMKIDGGATAGVEAYSSYEMDIEASSDGRFLALSQVDDSGVETVVRDSSYFRTQRVFKGIRRSCIAGGPDDLYVVGIENSSTEERLAVFDLSTGSRLMSVNVPHGWNVLELAASISHQVAMVATDGKDWEVVLFRPDERRAWLLENPEGIVIRDISMVGDEIAFSWFSRRPDGSLARYGILDLSSERITRSLSMINISGGVQVPRKIGDEVFFVGRFFEEERVRRISEDEMELGEAIEIKVTEIPLESLLQNHEISFFEYSEELNKTSQVGSLIADSKRYNPFSFFRCGSFLPFSASSIPMPGIFWYTEDPTESYVLETGIGYELERNILQASISWSDSSYFLTFGLPIDLSATFSAGYSFDYRQPHIQWFTGLNYLLHIDRMRGLDLNISSSLALGWIKRQFSLVVNPSLRLQMVRGYGMNPMERLGFVLQAGYSFELFAAGTLHSVRLDFAVLVPHLIFVDNTSRFVFNLPFEVGIVALPLQKWIDLNFHSVLFGYEIQKAAPWISTFFKRTYISFDGELGYRFADDSFTREFSILANLEFSPVLGSDIQNLAARLYSGAKWSDAKGLQFVIGISNDYFDFQNSSLQMNSSLNKR